MEKIVMINFSYEHFETLITNCVNSCLANQIQNSDSEKQHNRILNIKETAELLNLAIPTIYSKVSKSEIPHMKRGGKLYFSEKEIMTWLKEGKRKTLSEIDQCADKYISK